MDAGIEKEDHNIMNQGVTRSIFRWIHIVFAIPIVGYIYSPFEKIPNYAPATRFVFLPVMVLSGLWMWKGHALRRLISKKSAWQNEGSERT
jgi:thiosulfate reductase cytochrome b subunit